MILFPIWEIKFFSWILYHKSNKVFSLIIQEERQRELTSSIGSLSNDTVALLSKSAPPNSSSRIGKYPIRKDRPTCNHCDILGHTIEKCYKVHGYSLGYTSLQREDLLIQHLFRPIKSLNQNCHNQALRKNNANSFWHWSKCSLLIKFLLHIT